MVNARRRRPRFVRKSLRQEHRISLFAARSYAPLRFYIYDVGIGFVICTGNDGDDDVDEDGNHFSLVMCICIRIDADRKYFICSGCAALSTTQSTVHNGSGSRTRAATTKNDEFIFIEFQLKMIFISFRALLCRRTSACISVLFVGVQNVHSTVLCCIQRRRRSEHASTHWLWCSMCI